MKMLIQIASVFTFLYRGLLQLARVVASRTQVASWSARDRQKGASALEYIILAATIIIIIGVLATNDTVKETLEAAFEKLFRDAADMPAGEG